MKEQLLFFLRKRHEMKLFCLGVFGAFCSSHEADASLRAGSAERLGFHTGNGLKSARHEAGVRVRSRCSQCWLGGTIMWLLSVSEGLQRG